MEACGILLRIFVAIFLGICVFSCSCDAASACPVRAVRQFTPEGVKCVCMDAFYGDKCQFRGKLEVSFRVRSLRKSFSDVGHCARIQTTLRIFFTRLLILVDDKILCFFYLGHNSFVINGTWTGANDARVVWEADGVELFKLFTRKVKYDVFGLPIYGKWRAGVQLHTLNDAGHKEYVTK